MKRSTAMKISKFVSRLLSTSVLLLLLTGCAPAESSQPEDSSKIRAVATIFPQYDFLRQIGGDHLELTMLLKPGYRFLCAAGETGPPDRSVYVGCGEKADPLQRVQSGDHERYGGSQCV